jgi:hypothetical protein
VMVVMSVVGVGIPYRSGKVSCGPDESTRMTASLEWRGDRKGDAAGVTRAVQCRQGVPVSSSVL